MRKVKKCIERVTKLVLLRLLVTIWRDAVYLYRKVEVITGSAVLAMLVFHGLKTPTISNPLELIIMNNKISSMSALFGAAVVASAALAPLASAADVGFAATSLNAGYTLAENDAAKSEGEHKCGEAKCGAEKKAEGEHKCGEAKCGADKKEEKKADAEHKCGEAKCGADKKEEKKAE
ncbi:HvfA family oxazolone/thioamide-modified RiPP metallophore [Cellvibrio sp. OA-2007]|uniref:HvfA family oxazolone/thioamide-modified RiPP metallophore n=1 Tax=Cellvibrio sp. OA-2007 TaxID=529823 RepID=UPI000A999D9F|nr:hypothetical protein [Cellvibrio sp. OA-2007]